MISVTKWLFLFETILVIVAVILSKIEQRYCPRTTARFTTRSRAKQRKTSVIIPEETQPTQFSLRYLEIATNNYSDQNRIGNGGFGCVYKGIIGGRIVAIKRIVASSLKLQTDVDKEISLLSSLENDNLVKLLGFCSEADNYLLVYEYVQNGDIANFLTDEKKRCALDWAMRFNIIIGIAKGLFYLHHGSDQQIIHCDVKPENVLLDDHYNAKIADFGLSRILQVNKTHITDRNVAGTPGYIAPELWFEQRYSTRSDVYSYGLLILEILVGCTIRQYAQSNQENLIHVVWKQYRMKKPFTDIVDSCLVDKFVQDQVSRCIQIGLLCVQNYRKRPSIEAVLEMLCSDTQLPAPYSPAFFEESQNSEESTRKFQIPCLCMELRKAKRLNLICIMPNATAASPVPYTPAGFPFSAEKHLLSKLQDRHPNSIRKLEIFLSTLKYHI